MPPVIVSGQARRRTKTSVGGDPHAYFENLLARGDYVKAYSLRPIPGRTSSTDPYYENQLTAFLAGSGPHQPTYDVAYDAAKYSRKL
jgi:hypothetical protein